MDHTCSTSSSQELFRVWEHNELTSLQFREEQAELAESYSRFRGFYDSLQVCIHVQVHILIGSDVIANMGLSSSHGLCCSCQISQLGYHEPAISTPLVVCFDLESS